MRQWQLQDPAQLKAQWCAHLGVSVYIESDPAQAAEIRRWLRKYGATTTVAVARKEKQ